jgi:hypothetical protein
VGDTEKDVVEHRDSRELPVELAVAVLLLLKDTAGLPVKLAL